MRMGGEYHKKTLTKGLREDMISVSKSETSNKNSQNFCGGCVGCFVLMPLLVLFLGWVRPMVMLA